MNSKPASASPPCIHDAQGNRWRWSDCIQVKALMRVTGYSRRQMTRLLAWHNVPIVRVYLTGSEIRRPYTSVVKLEDAQRFVQSFCRVNPAKAGEICARLQQP